MVRHSTADLDFIESIHGIPNFTVEDWGKLRRELSKYITLPSPKSKRVRKPINDVFNYFLYCTDISDKFACLGLLNLLAMPTRLEQVIHSFQDDLHLNIWLIVIGTSGVSRKNSVIGRTLRILEEMDGINDFPSNFTTPAFMVEMIEDSDRRMVVHEISKLMSSAKQEINMILPAMMCEVFDCESKVDNATRSYGTETIHDPYLTILGGIQPHIGFKQFNDDELMGQGYLLRFIYCLELEKTRYRQRSPQNSILNKYREKAIEFVTITKGSKINDFYWQLTPEVENYLEYCEIIEKRSSEDFMSPIYSYYSRTQEYMLKFAALLENARQTYYGNTEESVTCGTDTMNLAVKITRMFEQEFREMIRHIRTLSESKEVETDKESHNFVLNIIKNERYGVITLGDLIMRSGYNRNKLREVTDSLQEADYIAETITPKIKEGRGSSPKLYYYLHGVIAMDTGEHAQMYWTKAKGYHDIAKEIEKNINGK